MTTTTVTMWGLFWKGTNVLAVRRLYRNKAACSSGHKYRYWPPKSFEPEDVHGRVARWRALKPDQKYALIGWECRAALSLEHSEATP